MANQSTLRQALSGPAPRMNRCKAFTRETRVYWPKIQGRNIIQWNGFTWFSLNQDFGELLQHLSYSEASVNLSDWMPSPFEGSVHFIQDWYEERITRTIEDALNKLGYRIPLVSLTANSLSSNMRFFPAAIAKGDIGFYIGTHGNGLSGFIVGLFRSRNDTTASRMIDNVTAEECDPMLNSLRKLANFCRMAKTRYGFIYTNDEVILCRFPEYDGEYVQIKSILLNNNDPFTVQQALWYLCMMGVYDYLGRPHSGFTLNSYLLGTPVSEICFVSERRDAG